MTHGHTFRPTDDFRDRLEREILLRHRQPATIPATRARAPIRRARGTAIVGLALVLGATAGFASAQIGRGAERDSLLAAARAEAMLANARRDLARAEVDDVERKVRAGLVDAEALLVVNADLAEAERRRNRLAIDIEEITTTGRSPRDDLNAPMVGGRDFVKLRIEADAMAAQARLRAAESAQATVDQRVRAGAASNLTGSAAALDVAMVRADLAVLFEKLSLRAEFLKSGTAIDELTRRLHTMQLRQDAAVLQQRLGVARERLTLVERQRSLGAVGDVELLRARLEVKETELSLQKTVQLLRAK